MKESTTPNNATRTVGHGVACSRARRVDRTSLSRPSQVRTTDRPHTRLSIPSRMRSPQRTSNRTQRTGSTPSRRRPFGPEIASADNFGQPSSTPMEDGGIRTSIRHTGLHLQSVAATERTAAVEAPARQSAQAALPAKSNHKHWSVLERATMKVGQVSPTDDFHLPTGQSLRISESGNSAK